MKCCLISNIGPHYRWPIYNLMSQTFDIDFYFGENSNFYENVKVFDYKKLKGFKYCLKNKNICGPLWYQKGTLSLLFRNYDEYIILGAPFCLSSWFFLVLAKVLNKRTIAWTHGILRHHTGFKKTIFNIYYGLFDVLMTYNERSKCLLVEDGLSEGNIYVIGNSLDTDAHRQIRERLVTNDIFFNHFGNSNPVVLYCGRIQQVKRIDLLLDAVLLLKKGGFITNVVLVGGDSPDTDIAKMVHERDMDDLVWVYGPCYEEKQLANIFYNSDVCVSPGNVGLTAIHSLSFGCPVITNGNFDMQMPEFEAIRPGVTGDFFRENDVNDLANVIKKWTKHSLTEKEEIRKNAFEEIDSKWNIYYQIDILKKVIRKS